MRELAYLMFSFYLLVAALIAVVVVIKFADVIFVTLVWAAVVFAVIRLIRSKLRARRDPWTIEQRRYARVSRLHRAWKVMRERKKLGYTVWIGSFGPPEAPVPNLEIDTEGGWLYVYSERQGPWGWVRGRLRVHRIALSEVQAWAGNWVGRGQYATGCHIELAAAPGRAPLAIVPVADRDAGEQALLSIEAAVRSARASAAMR